MSVQKLTTVDNRVKVKRPSRREILGALYRLALLYGAEDSGDQERIARNVRALFLLVDSISPQFAELIAAGYGPMDAHRKPLYAVCPRCGRLLRQYVRNRRGVRISTGHPEDCVRCAEMGVFS